MDQQFWAALALQFPLVAAILLALQKGWIRIGKSHDEQMAEKDKQIAFIDMLRVKAEARVERLSEAAVIAAETLKAQGEALDRAVGAAESAGSRAAGAPRRGPARG